MPRLQYLPPQRDPRFRGLLCTDMPYFRLFILQTLVVALIGVIHLAALRHSLYWHYVWLDLPVHFLGGVWLALAGTWLLLRSGMRAEVPIIFSIVIIGSIAWEIFELAAGVPIERNFALDTVIDLTMDVAGGILGFILARLSILHGTIARHGETQNDPS